MMYVQTLTPEGRVHIHLQKVKSLFVLTENLISRGGPTRTICAAQIVWKSIQFCNLYKCDVETESADLNMDSEAGNVLCPAEKLKKLTNLAY